jgi:hypothetical protein
MSELTFREASFESVGGSPMARILAMTMIQQENQLQVQSARGADVAVQAVGQSTGPSIGGR